MDGTANSNGIAPPLPSQQVTSSNDTTHYADERNSPDGTAKMALSELERIIDVNDGSPGNMNGASEPECRARLEAQGFTARGEVMKPTQPALNFADIVRADTTIAKADTVARSAFLRN
eukprot:CAMPEP_0169139088 /NCGR_PEP_ID=MMETSP1015-20121227/42734_1 /TAXON_ID=342587 /ORGANISM="Karlodinium micrum, Strain CCMP2283" /LENGTH=117 /DNA_ID=CAMNT_0009204673 /DNA_START=174 /DNA_END=524 /DNA_ORIENTATION=-